MELDGFEFHGDRASFEEDRERDARALQAGWATLRVTWTRLQGAPEAEARRLGDVLSQRG